MQSEYTCKEALRTMLKARRTSILCRAEKERVATEHILPYMYGSVMVYVSIGSELSTALLIEKLMARDDITAYVPITKNGEITPVRLLSIPNGADRNGNIGKEFYAEDSAMPIIDSCVTPVIGYNRRGHRIGYGKGCYDKFFSGMYGNCKKIGFAFACQKCDFAADGHDVALDMCVTEEGIEVFS